MSDTLVIFLDGYGYDLLQREGDFLDSFDNIAPLQPGFGFSANIYYELFAGLTPDEVGYLNKFVRREEGPPVADPPELLAKALDALGPTPLLSRGFHILYDRLAGTGQLATIPFQYLQYFERNEYHDVFYTDSFETVFNVFDFDIVTTLDNSFETPEDAVEATIETAETANRLFVGLSIDGITHRHGVDAPRRIERARNLDDWCASIVEAFRDNTGDSDPDIVIFSDHGFVDVEQSVSVDLESRFGTPDPDSYLYFLDTTVARVWCEDEALRDDIATYFDSLDVGRVLTDAERADFGITSESFGDIIFLLEEGIVFHPSFMGGRLDEAMHGYDPVLSSQRAFFASNVDDNPELPETTVEVYDFLCDVYEH